MSVRINCSIRQICKRILVTTSLPLHCFFLWKMHCFSTTEPSCTAFVLSTRPASAFLFSPPPSDPWGMRPWRIRRWVSLLVLFCIVFQDHMSSPSSGLKPAHRSLDSSCLGSMLLYIIREGFWCSLPNDKSPMLPLHGLWRKPYHCLCNCSKIFFLIEQYGTITKVIKAQPRFVCSSYFLPWTIFSTLVYNILLCLLSKILEGIRKR